MTKLEELAQRFNDAVMNPEHAKGILEGINWELNNLAASESGVPLHYLADPEGAYEERPEYRLYFQTLSTMLAQVYSIAAVQLTRFPRLHAEVGR